MFILQTLKDDNSSSVKFKMGGGGMSFLASAEAGSSGFPFCFFLAGLRTSSSTIVLTAIALYPAVRILSVKICIFKKANKVPDELTLYSFDNNIFQCCLRAAFDRNVKVTKALNRIHFHERSKLWKQCKVMFSLKVIYSYRSKIQANHANHACCSRQHNNR